MEKVYFFYKKGLKKQVFQPALCYLLCYTFEYNYSIALKIRLCNTSFNKDSNMTPI